MGEKKVPWRGWHFQMTLKNEWEGDRLIAVKKVTQAWAGRWPWTLHSCLLFLERFSHFSQASVQTEEQEMLLQETKPLAAEQKPSVPLQFVKPKPGCELADCAAQEERGKEGREGRAGSRDDSTQGLWCFLLLLITVGRATRKADAMCWHPCILVCRSSYPIPLLPLNPQPRACQTSTVSL